MKLKPGVRILGMKPETIIGLIIAESVHRSLGKEFEVTSAIEGSHSNASLHYAGQAFDVRTRGNTPEETQAIASALRQALGNTDFDVVIEGDHIHVEYQPKGAY